MRSLLRDLLASFRNPEFWALSSWLDIIIRYRQSRLGVLWLLAPSVIYIWGVGSFFASMQHIAISDFVAYVAVGWTVFRVINSVIIESTSAFASAAPFILDGHIRLTDFVLRVIAKAMFYFIVSLPVVGIALAVSPYFSWIGLSVSLLTFPVVVANALWIGVLFALVGARFRDLSQFISNIFMFAFLLTPIIWHADAMPAGSLRGEIMRFNPLFHMVEIIRAPVLGQAVAPSTIYYMALMSIMGWLVTALAYRRYARFVPIWI